MLMMKNFGLIDRVGEQRVDTSLLANVLRCATSLDLPRFFDLTEVRAKDEANASATKRVERQREMSFMFSVVLEFVDETCVECVDRQRHTRLDL